MVAETAARMTEKQRGDASMHPGQALCMTDMCNPQALERRMHRTCMDLVSKRLLKAACVLITMGLGTSGGFAFLRDACASHTAFRTRALCRGVTIAAC